MKNYIEVATMRFGLTVYQVRHELARKNIILGPELSDTTANNYGFEVVRIMPRPEGDRVTETTPELVDGKWEQRWEVREYSEEERQERLESKRQSHLSYLDQALENTRAIGYPFETENGDVEHIQLRDRDIRFLTNLSRILAEGDTEDQLIRTYENNNHTLSAEEAAILIDDALDYDMALMRRWRSLKDALLSATEESQLKHVGDYITVE